MTHMYQVPSVRDGIVTFVEALLDWLRPSDTKRAPRKTSPVLQVLLLER